jgi:hypothetical protein
VVNKAASILVMFVCFFLSGRRMNLAPNELLVKKISEDWSKYELGDLRPGNHPSHKMIRRVLLLAERLQ